MAECKKTKSKISGEKKRILTLDTRISEWKVEMQVPLNIDTKSF